MSICTFDIFSIVAPDLCSQNGGGFHVLVAIDALFAFLCGFDWGGCEYDIVALWFPMLPLGDKRLDSLGYVKRCLGLVPECGAPSVWGAVGSGPGVLGPTKLYPGVVSGKGKAWVPHLPLMRWENYGWSRIDHVLG